MKINLLILLFLACYVFGNIGMTSLGISNTIVLYSLLGYACIMMILTKDYLDNTAKWPLWIIAGGIIMLLVRWVTGILQESIQSTLILVLPAILISLFPLKYESESIKTRITVSGFIYWFYIIECCLAIVEFVMKQHVFGWIEIAYNSSVVDFDNQYFRSVALCGGPLLNAQIVTTIMLFFLFDLFLSPRKKILLWFLGLIAVLCFNARMAIVINILGLILYIGKEISRVQWHTRIKYIALSIFIGVTVSFLLIMGLGNRLTATTSLADDDSISIRLALFKYFFNSDLQVYIWGHSMDELRRIMNIIGIKVIENFWIIYIYHFGVVFTGYFTFCYFKLVQYFLRPFPTFDKIVISGLFVILISANNSIASSHMPLFIFLLCCYANQHKWEYMHNLQIYLRRLKDENINYGSLFNWRWR